MSPLRLALREARDRAKMSQARLAELAGLRVATISDIERGRKGNVTLDVLDRLAKALGVKPAELLAGDQPTKRRKS